LVLAASARLAGTLLLGWAAVSLFVVGWAYLRNDPSVFGKRPDGARSRLVTLLLFPYLLVLGTVWHAVRVCSRERCVSSLGPGIWIARRLLPDEIPSEVETLVDLTCELLEPVANRRDRAYVCFPILDGAAPSCAAMDAVLARLDGVERVLIHCAQGHGRTGLFAAALLLRRGWARTPEHALARVVAARPGVRLSAVQLRALHQYAERHQCAWTNDSV
jgi:protein-tyrosine phosphatase